MIAAWSDDKIMDTNKLPPESRRALEEAENRRRAAISAKPPKEINGRSGPEPTRFGDWENKGIASDF
jgi:hypothetical protein